MKTQYLASEEHSARLLGIAYGAMLGPVDPRSEPVTGHPRAWEPWMKPGTWSESADRMWAAGTKAETHVPLLRAI